MGRTAAGVLTVPAYAALATGVAVVALSGFVLSLNATTVELALTGTVPPTTRGAILLHVYPFVGTRFGPLGGALLVAVSVLFGVEAAIVACRFRSRSDPTGDGYTGVSRAGIGAFVVAWVAYGLAVLAGGLSLLAVGSPLLVLPFGGLELPGLALVAALLSVHWMTNGSRG